MCGAGTDQVALRARWTWRLVLGSILVSGCATTTTGITVPVVLPLPMSLAPTAVVPPPASSVPVVVPPPPVVVPQPGVSSPSAPAAVASVPLWASGNPLESLIDALVADTASTRAFRLARQSQRSASGRIQDTAEDRTSREKSYPDRLLLSHGSNPGRWAERPEGAAATRDSSSRMAELSRNVEKLKLLQPGGGGSGGGGGGTPLTTPAPLAAASAAMASSSADGLTLAKVAWNTPPTMAMGETAEVELRVTLDEKLFPGIAERIRAGGATTSETVELSRDLTAKLESTAFDVKPDGERRQAVLKGRDAVWSWVISPKLKGKQKLLLSITAHVADGPSIAPLVRTINVTAGASDTTDAIKDFVVKNWERLLTKILLPLAAWAWKVRQKRRQAQLTSPLPALPHEKIRDAA